MMKRMRALAGLAVCAGLLGVATPATAADFSVMGIVWDTNDLSETFGAGLRVGFPIGSNAAFDITAAYFEDFDNKFEDVDTIGVEIGTITADFGITYFFGEDRTGFLVGGGATYGLMDVSNIEVSGNPIFNGETVQLRGEADDEFGFYGKIGYQAQNGFFVEGLYRDLDVSVEDVEFAGEDFEIPLTTDFDLDMAGYQINLGWRF